MKTFQDYEKSARMITQIENYIPVVEAEQLQSLKEIGLNVEIPLTDGKRDCYINDRCSYMQINYGLYKC